MMHGMTPRSLHVPGARLHYEVRGNGPLVLVLGSPMPAADFTPLAHALAGDHTVVTYDPRGLSHSTIDNPHQDATPELRADDVAALIDALGADRADVFGSSGGAVTGLALVTRHPEKVGTLIAHEPPLMELLPDPERQRAATEDIIETFHREGPPAAWMKFMRNAGFDVDQDSSAPVGPPPTPDEQAKHLADMTRFFDHELRYTAHYVPQIDALRKADIVIGVGADSAHLITSRTSSALAELLGVETVEFPGDHGGFIGSPGAFADRLREVFSARIPSLNDRERAEITP
jgi:pimeloyl-ACP methyl ester carboxylesterase